MLKNRFPNQYKVIIKKEKVNQNNGQPYFLAYKETIEAAAQNLSGNEFKLYIYLLSNKVEYEDFFSPDYFGRTYGVSADTARKLFQKLIEKGYLVKTAPHDCDFYEVPQLKPALTLKVEKRQVIDDNGEVFEWSYKEFKEAAGDGYTEDEIKAAWNSYEVVKED